MPDYLVVVCNLIMYDFVVQTAAIFALDFAGDFVVTDFDMRHDGRCVRHEVFAVSQYEFDFVWRQTANRVFGKRKVEPGVA